VKRLAIEYWTPLILWLVVIFWFSTDAFSSSETLRIIVPLLRLSFPSLSSTQLDFWHGVIRKLSHVTEYSILTLLAYRSLKHEQSGLAAVDVRAFSFVLMAATMDEFHQRLTLFRTSSPLDVGYDCLGAVGALWLISVYETRRLRAHSLL
jgi:VanZ family protein